MWTLLHTGYKYILEKNVQMTLEPEWCQVPCGYALQAVVTDVKAHVIETVTKYSTPQEAFPSGGEVFLLTQGQYYGSLAKVSVGYTSFLFSNYVNSKNIIHVLPCLGQFLTS